MSRRVRVLVRPKAGILDPQGQAVERALPALGFEGVANVHVGRLIELDVEDPSQRRRDVREAAREPADRGLRDRRGLSADALRRPALPRHLRRGRRAARVRARRRGDDPVARRHRPAGVDAIVVPGGFSYGDYLRVGAIARFAPIMESVIDVRARGRVRCSASATASRCCARPGLLPGALLPNKALRFVCRQVDLVVEHADTIFTNACAEGERLSIPAKHTTGCWYAPPELHEQVEANGQVLLRYARGRATSTARSRDVAGVRNEAGNVFGLMPHPEHAVDPLTGSVDGLKIFQSMHDHVASRVSDTAVAAAPRARPHRRRVRADRREARPRAERGRAVDVLAHVVRALRLQALEEAARPAADRGPATC